MNFPLTRIVYTISEDRIREVFLGFDPDVLVFTSTAGSSRFLQAVEPRELKKCRIFCIGDMTAVPFRNAGLDCTVPSPKTSLGLARAIQENCRSGSRIMVARSSSGSPVLTDELSGRSYELAEISLYDLEENIATELGNELKTGNYFGILITSSMEAVIFGKMLRSMNLNVEKIGLKVFAIGDPTASALRNLGIRTDTPAGDSDIESLVKRISDMYC
ncbi:MAG: uroporphyrinogen-III synthase [Thermoplasmata archaeon]